MEEKTVTGVLHIKYNTQNYESAYNYYKKIVRPISGNLTPRKNQSEKNWIFQTKLNLKKINETPR